MAATRIPVELGGGASQQLATRLQENRTGKAVGVYSICSANRFVLEAGMHQAIRDGSFLLIESTSSQVNQCGGYTGQNPAQFSAFIEELAGRIGLPMERIVLGGDHLGPNVWRDEGAPSAMQKAAELVRDCVLAGYTKIHLDASMRLAGDPGETGLPLPEDIVSERSAELCKAAEEAHAKLGNNSPPPLYVIGTEVPIPGGELSDSRAPEVTRADDALGTVESVRHALEARGLQSAWQRVIALVVQPGVEFGNANIFPYRSEAVRELSRLAETRWHGVFEAHSTDYQTPAALRDMVRDHFAILKVGPWLTFAFREAVFALASIEEEWLGGGKDVTLSHVPQVLEEAMLARPEYWRSYYQGDEDELRFARKYSLSDRARYYWPQPKVAAALKCLLDNLTLYPPPVALLGQFMPSQAARVLAHELSMNPSDVIRDKILEVIDHYTAVCGFGVLP